MPATRDTQTRPLVEPLAQWFRGELGVEPRDALKRARDAFSVLPASIIAQANSALLAGNWAAWCKALPEETWEGAATFADAPGGGGGVATNGAYEHDHEHSHEDGTTHAHNHWHYAGTTVHANGTTVAHDHDHGEGSPADGAADRYEAGRVQRADPPKPGAVVSSVTGAPVKSSEMEILQQFNASERVDLLAKAYMQRVFSERGIRPSAEGNTYRQALDVVGQPGYVEGQPIPQTQRFGEAATIPGTSVQATQEGRQDGSLFTTPQSPWEWDSTAGWQLRSRPVDQLKARMLSQPAPDKPLTFAERVLRYAENKAMVLGQPVPAQSSYQEARAAAMRMGEEMGRFEQQVIVDHQDVAAAAEAFRAERFMKFGETLSVKAALRAVDRKRG